jgi:hypothetical protein
MCIESDFARVALSARVFGAASTRVDFRGTGNAPRAHCAGTLKPLTVSLHPSAARVAATRSAVAESLALAARASLAS